MSLIVATIISLAVWGGMRDLPGIWGVVLGASIGGGFMLLTALSVLATSNTSASTTGAVVLGGWLLKIIILLIVLFLIKDAQFYDRLAFVVTVAVALIVVLGSEVWGVVTSKVTYVQ
ncbi:hypothetical protein [Corynebacterium sp. H130]|uniref:hypothetical protein n=1 Tax=Corynebacterium sp. H130 TaxID=3133444 RepID=UPI0030B22858